MSRFEVQGGDHFGPVAQVADDPGRGRRGDLQQGGCHQDPLGNASRGESRTFII